MLGLGLGAPLALGINLETIKIYVYKTFFFVEANRQITGINSKIKIDRKNFEILQLGTCHPTQTNNNQFRLTMTRRSAAAYCWEFYPSSVSITF